VEKILIVDDEPDVEILFNQRFRKKVKEGLLELHYARNGKEALEKLENDKEIDIVLTDINMPEMDGLTLLGHLVKLNRPIKAIVISAYGDMTNIRTAMNKGASDFVTKPIDFQDLEVTLDKIISQHSLHKKAVLAESKLGHIEKELEVARRIQQGMLPQNFELFVEDSPIELVGKMMPAKEVGGDFYDFFFLDENKLGILIADVSGKSVPACLFMAIARTILRTIAIKTESPSETLSRANELLCKENDSCMFVTTFYGIIDLNRGTLCFANAGHNPPFLLKAEGALSQLGLNMGIPLGVVSQKESHSPIYQNVDVELKEGDSLILYTDGVTEAMNSASEFYGEKRLEGILKAHLSTSLPQIVEKVIDDLGEFTKHFEQSDDITFLGLRYKHPLTAKSRLKSTPSTLVFVR